MSHQYKYHVHVCGEPKKNSLGEENCFRKDIYPVLDHPITPEDLEKIVADESKNDFFRSYSIPFHTLLEETGDFTYIVIYQILEFGKWITYSQFYIQDRRFTSSTAKSDYRKFIRFLYPCDSAIAPKEWSIEYTKVLIFQEIPEE